MITLNPTTISRTARTTNCGDDPVPNVALALATLSCTEPLLCGDQESLGVQDNVHYTCGSITRKPSVMCSLLNLIRVADSGHKGI